MNTEFIQKTVKRHGTKVIGISGLAGILSLFVWLQDHIVWKNDFREHLADESKSNTRHEQEQADRLTKLEERIHELEHLLMKPHN